MGPRRDPGTLVDDLAQLGRRLIGGLGESEPERAARLTLERLAQAGDNKPWLLVYDNVVDLDSDLDSVRGWTPDPKAHVLFTSRRPRG